MPRLQDYSGRQRPRKIAYIRSLLPTAATFILFSLALLVYGLLSSLKSPAKGQRLGWQAWDVVDGGRHRGEDFDDLALPLQPWDPIARHRTGLTELVVKSCLTSPKLLTYCRPRTTPEEDKLFGEWVLVDSDLTQKSGFYNVHIYYRRTRRRDVSFIHDIQVLPEPPPSEEPLEGWVMAEGNLLSGQRGTQQDLRLWYRRQPSGNSTDGKEDIITELLPLYGDGPPAFGFQRVPGGKIINGQAGRWESVDLTFRRGAPVAPAASPPVFHSDGTFKVMQIADLHYSVGTGECRDTTKVPCTGDSDTEAWLAEALDAEKPDLVVFSGDQLNGQGTSYDASSVLAKFAQPVIERKIPWAAVFGNHDSEIADDRLDQMRALQAMPYSLARAGPASVDGVGNYDIPIHADKALRTQVFTLYFLDSHAYQKSWIPFKHADYDYLKQSQIDWYLKTSASVPRIERPYKPEAAVGSRKRLQRLERQSTLSKPNALMFFHIPLPEAYSPADTIDGKELDLGDQFDRKGSSKHNGEFFTKAIQFASDDSVSAGGELATEVKILSHGHCHNTDRCRRVKGVWMCFDGGSSYAGYGQVGFDRRVRLYNISQWGETVTTYKRLTSGEILHEQVLVGGATPPE